MVYAKSRLILWLITNDNLRPCNDFICPTTVIGHTRSESFKVDQTTVNLRNLIINSKQRQPLAEASWGELKKIYSLNKIREKTNTTRKCENIQVSFFCDWTWFKLTSAATNEYLLFNSHVHRRDNEFNSQQLI